MVTDFIKNEDPSATLVLPDRLMINQCFYHFRNLYAQAAKKGGGKAGAIEMPQQKAIMPEASPSKEASGADSATIEQKD